METKTKTNQNHRELTKTEIKIASAQIEDRLERILAAQRELDRLSSGEGKYARIHEMPQDQYSAAFNDIRKNILTKYEIPRGVYAFYDGNSNDTRDKRALLGLFKLIPRFVAGSLTTEFIDSHIIFRCLEIDEMDYGWVFLDWPMFFYGGRMEIPATDEEEKLADMDRIREELISIGTRLKTKWAGMSAYPRSYISGCESTAGIINSVTGEVLGINHG
jgi:hypothetical protein